MKVKTIFKVAMVGLLSLSFFLSGMPVMAFELKDKLSEQQTELEIDKIKSNTDLKKDLEKDTNEDATIKGEVEDRKEEIKENKTEETEDTKIQEIENNKTEEIKTEGIKTEDTKKEEIKKNKTEETEDTKIQEIENNKTEEIKTEDIKTEDTKTEEIKENKTEETEDTTKIQEIETTKSENNPLKVLDGNIVVDGDLSDWAEVTTHNSEYSNVDSWKVAYSPDGNMLYFCYMGNASTEWDYSFASSSNSFYFSYMDGTIGENSSISINAWKDGALVKNSFWGDVSGANIAVTNRAHGNNAGPYTVEFSVPINFFHSLDFILTFGDTSINSRDIEQINGNIVEEEKPVVYTGITIDGNYSDWAAVKKTEISCLNSIHPECLSQVAVVYDGDWFYIYIKDGQEGNAAGSGTHSNGKFAITSDLGYETDIQLTTAPTVNGVDGAQISYVGSEWEVAIPKNQLPKYREKLSFGFYLEEPFISDIVNLQEDSGNNLDQIFHGIVYDGQYEDWEDYGHSTIEYATAGSQESQVDAKGALYSDGERLYGHVVTNMSQHLQEAGGEFTSAVTIAFNQNASDLVNGTFPRELVFYPRCVAVDENGTINWNPQLSGLAEGIYEFYLASTDAWHTSTNINNLNEMDQMYGKMIMTIGKNGKDEMEFYLDLPSIAKKFGVDATELKQIAAQFGRIGQQWIFTAGASTGAFTGIILCIISVGLVLWHKKRKFKYAFTTC